MAVNKSRQLDPVRELLESKHIGITQDTEHDVRAIIAENSTHFVVSSGGLSLDPNLHSAFMQCPMCCNCTAGCSFYGQGNFDEEGNFISSQ